jgi:hypothetical protein
MQLLGYDAFPDSREKNVKVVTDSSTPSAGFDNFNLTADLTGVCACTLRLLLRMCDGYGWHGPHSGGNVVRGQGCGFPTSRVLCFLTTPLCTKVLITSKADSFVTQASNTIFASPNLRPYPQHTMRKTRRSCAMRKN